MQSIPPLRLSCFAFLNICNCSLHFNLAQLAFPSLSPSSCVRLRPSDGRTYLSKFILAIDARRTGLVLGTLVQT